MTARTRKPTPKAAALLDRATTAGAALDTSVLAGDPRTSQPFRGSDEVEALGDAGAKTQAERAKADEVVDMATADLDIIHGIRGQVVLDALEAAAERLRAEAWARKAGR